MELINTEAEFSPLDIMVKLIWAKPKGAGNKKTLRINLVFFVIQREASIALKNPLA